MSVTFGTPELFTGSFGGAGGNVSVTPPPGLAASESWWLLCFADADPGVTISCSGFSGATSEVVNDDGAGYPCYRALAKVAGASEGSVNVNFGTGAYDVQVVSMRGLGTHATTPIGNVTTVKNDAQSTSTPNYNVPSVAIQANGSAVINVVAYHSTGGWPNSITGSPTGLTNVKDRIGPTGSGIYPQWIVATGSANAGTFAPSGPWALLNYNSLNDLHAVMQTIEVRVAGAATVATGSLFRGRRNMPGRGPYSRGRYYRPRLEHRGSPASSFLLVVADATHGHAADAPSLSQANTLAVADATHGHAVDALSLIQAHVLAVQEALHAHAAEAPALTQANTLAVGDATHGHSADGLALVQAHVLAMQDALHAHAAEAPTLSEANLLTVGDATHGHSAEAPALTQGNVLAVADALHSQTAEAPALVQAHVLAVADALNAHAADQITLSTGETLAPADATHGHAADTVSLTQANVLVVQETSHGHSAEQITLSQATTLAVADALHAHAAEALTLGYGALLVVADAGHGHAAESPSLTQAGALIVSDALHAHLAEALDLRMPHEPGDIQLFVVTAGDRLLVVAPSQRLYTVQ